MTSKPQMDLKREEFRKYLEREGVLESLTKSLVTFPSLTIFVYFDPDLYVSYIKTPFKT